MTEQERLDVIKNHMPETYKSIQSKAQEMGKQAFALVRRGLRGEPNCFWAMERGHVVGKPFSLQDVQRDIAQYMVTFGCEHVVVWAEPLQPPPAIGGGEHGQS